MRLAAALGEQLVVIGDGEARRQLETQATTQTRFLGRLPREEALAQLARARACLLLPRVDRDGSGAEGGAQPVSCPTCHGAGKVRSQQGFFTVERTCPGCRGAGQVIDKPCQGCNGSGRTQKEKALSVKIPPGVEDDTRIRLSGEGEAGLNGAPAGDLYIFLSLGPHRLFQREQADIFCKVPMSMTAAALGGVVEVPTIDGGKAKVNVPPGTQTGQQFRLRSKGMSVLNARQRGDMYVEARIETPVNLSRKQRELLQEFEKAGAGRSFSPESEGFFAKVKEFWDDLKD